MTQLKYNNVYPFSGQPLPFVARSDDRIRAGEYWITRESITLNGQITGCSYQKILSGQSQIINNFRKDFQTFEIEQNGNIIYSLPYAQVESVNFSQGRYIGVLDYEVSLFSYPQIFSSGTFGILEPQDSWDFQEQNDKTVSITHNVSARGYNTHSVSSNALDNARMFVQSRTGWRTGIEPLFIQVCSGIQPCLKSISENINRFDGTYSITENYVLDAAFQGGGLLRYTTTVNSGIENGLTSVNVDGQIEGCGSNLSGLRDRYKGFDIYSIAVDAYSGYCGLIDLNPEPLSSGVQENPRTPLISFEASFDNNKLPSVYVDYSFNVNSGENGIVSVDVGAAIRARQGLKDRFERVSGYYKNVNLRIFDRAYEAYTGAYPNVVAQLNPAFITSGVRFDKFGGEIDVNASFNNRPLAPSGLDKFDYTINITPSYTQIGATPVLDVNSLYCVQDLGFRNRADLQINGNAVINNSLTTQEGIALVKSNLNNILIQYANQEELVLEQQSLSTGNAGQGRQINFGYRWSFHSPFNAMSGDYKTIQTLKVK